MSSYGNRPPDYEQMWSNYLKPKSDWRRRKERKAVRSAIAGVMLQVLRAGCSTANWYPLQEIHVNCLTWSKIRCDMRVTNGILKELGFTHRRIKFGSLQVYVNLENPEEQPPKEIGRVRLTGRDAVRQFAKEHIQSKEANLILKAELYAAFIEYCRHLHLPSLSKNSFSLHLPEYVPNVKAARKIVNGKRVGIWRDITLT